MQLQESILDHNLAPVLVELPKTYDVDTKAWDVVDIGEGTIFAIDAHKHDCAASLDVHHRPVTQFHCATHGGVELEEDGQVACHVVAFARVEEPPDITVFLLGEVHLVFN